MPRFLRSTTARVGAALATTATTVAACALWPLVVSAQQAPTTASEQLTRMRADLANARYAAVVQSANAWLESARPITRADRVQLWQLLAAAYYPRTAEAQKPDSARLPLEALVRQQPDFTMARELSWPGLDSLTERVRAQTFAAASRPGREYILSTSETGAIRVVASRPTRFRLISVAEASGRQALHDSSGLATSADLRLRTHDAGSPIFTDGEHRVIIWAFDGQSGDSLSITHRVRALRRDLPPSPADSVVTATSAPPRPATAPTATTAGTTPRTSMLLGGIAVSVATVLIAQDLRPNGAIRATYHADDRAFLVAAAMLGAAAMNFARARRPTRATEPVRPVVTPRPMPPAPVYRVRLQFELTER